jgi:RNA polymerase sigma-70 factor (ECF subfamily)
MRAPDDGPSDAKGDRVVPSGDAKGARVVPSDAKGARVVPSDAAVPADPDASLVPRLVRRDERAFNDLVRAYEGRVTGLLLRMLGDRAEAEDMAQEVFVQVFKAIDTFRGDARLGTWIYRIAINLAKNRAKYLRLRTTSAAPVEAAEREADAAGLREAPIARVDRPDELARGRELEAIVRRCLLRLDPAFRECLVLRDLEDLPYEEIAVITELPVGTVKSRIHRARQELRAMIEREFGEGIP